ncbi:DUF6616 family protein [Bradyrhizobium sp.]|uniref:DUF6616 family protein n=1 Tax=Bradyrhizobium sp. TaxID=376 RepID=UPI001D969CF8|nr:DUF6616 family protein [Bradyrhizobium sp.]MBI5322443.1 hypothetical protein [Bradyrhizobium sp.]
MHVFIELWKAKPSWISLALPEREKFMEAMGSATKLVFQREGIEIAGWGFCAPAVDHRAPYGFFALYRFERLEAFASLQTAIMGGLVRVLRTSKRRW